MEEIKRIKERENGEDKDIFPEKFRYEGGIEANNFYSAFIFVCRASYITKKAVSMGIANAEGKTKKEKGSDCGKG